MPAFAPARKSTRKRRQPAIDGLQHDVPLDFVQAAPRRKRMRGLTTFNIVLMLIAFAALLVVYISNVVAVDGLMMEQIAVEREEKQLLQDRESLRAEINMLSSYNRIQKIAVEELGLVHANQQPYSLTVFGRVPAISK